MWWWVRNESNTTRLVLCHEQNKQVMKKLAYLLSILYLLKCQQIQKIQICVWLLMMTLCCCCYYCCCCEFWLSWTMSTMYAVVQNRTMHTVLSPFLACIILPYACTWLFACTNRRIGWILTILCMMKTNFGLQKH